MRNSKEYIGSIVWPFYRYDVLMPMQEETDLFQWLYLSLIVYQNEEMKKDKNNYDASVAAEARRIIKVKFAGLLDDAMLDNIIAFAEASSVLYDKATNKQILKEDTFSFLETYQNLFTEQVTVQRVFQDAMCGDVVPCFKEMDYLRDATRDGKLVLKSISKQMPTREQIRKALLYFNKARKSSMDEIIEIDEYEDIVDEDAEVDFTPFTLEAETEVPVQKQKPVDGFSVYFIENTKCEFLLEVPVYSNGIEVFVDSPFDPELTTKWMNKRLKQARAVCAELDEYISEAEKGFVSKKEPEELPEYIYRKGVADQLTKCSELYRLIEHLPQEYNDLKKIVVEIDKYFVAKNESYFNKVGKFLECLLAPLADHSDKEDRQYFDYEQYCSEIENTCLRLGVVYRPLISRNIFDAWLKAWEHFKADVANLFLSNSRMRGNKQAYPEFIQDAFNLYDKRSQGSHYKKAINYVYDDEDIEKLFKITRVLIELI